MPKLIDFLRDRDVDDEELASINEHILSLLRTPDDRAFHARRLWAEFEGKVCEFIQLCGREDSDGAREQLADIHRSWVTLHDHDVDHIYGLMDVIVRRWGEEALRDMWEHMVGGLFTSRYAKFDIAQYSWQESLPTNIYLAMEAMRGHLVGPGRRGNFEFEGDEDPYTFRFDPCGSGGHLLRGDQEVMKTPPRMEPPYNWAVLEEEHDFAWNKKGVCLYCTNCCVVMQLKPIENFGYPVRVVEPPTYPDRKDAKCTWHVYQVRAKCPSVTTRTLVRRNPNTSARVRTPSPDQPVAIVTGAAGGLGLAVTELLLEAGMRVHMVDVDEARLVDGSALFDGAAHTLVADVALTSECDRVVKQAEERSGRVDVLVNCAAILHRVDFFELDEATFARIIDTNLRSVFWLCRDVIPGMKKREWGRIVNITSVGSIRGVTASHRPSTNRQRLA